MANLTLRLVKGSPLTNAEVDNNFDNLNTSKLELSGGTLTGALTLHADPTQALQAATKQYVDEVAEGLQAKPAARAATNNNLSAIYDNGVAGVGATLTADTNRAFTSLDGVTSWAITTPPMGVLVKNQTNPAHNGRYNLTSLGEVGVSPWVLTRCSLCDEADEIPGAYTFVQFGTVNGGTGWVQTVADPDTFTVGTDAIIVAQFSGAGTFTAGTGLTLTGNQFAIADDQLLPTQTGNNGRFLTTNGTVTAWADVPPPNDGALTLTVAGTGLSGSASFSANQAGNSTFTVTSNATSANTVGAIVARDGSGNFTAGTITAALSGNASTATILQTTRTINGVNFNGSANITVTANTTSTLTLGTGLTGTSFNGSAAVTAAVSYGTTAGTACQGNDSRLSDARQATNTNTQLASLGVGTAASGTAGEIRATNNITAYFSDDRLKTKLGNIEDALAKVRTLSGFYYQPNEVAESLGYEVVREVGVSAQQVQAVQPEIVVPAPIDDRYLTVRYERLVPLLIEAIKEMDGEIQSLKTQLKG
jgi:hypothetical protein